MLLFIVFIIIIIIIIVVIIIIIIIIIIVIIIIYSIIIYSITYINYFIVKLKMKDITTFLYLIILLILTPFLYDFMVNDLPYYYEDRHNNKVNKNEFPSRNYDSIQYTRTLSGYTSDTKIIEDFVAMNKKFYQKGCSVLSVEDVYYKNTVFRKYGMIIVYECDGIPVEELNAIALI